jgi:hypothetical protein
MSELDDILPATVTVKLRKAGEIEVSPMAPIQLARFARAVKPIAAGGVQDLAGLDRAAMISLFADHGEAIIAAVAAATGLSESAVGEECSLDEVVDLAAAVWEVNADFFALRLAPAIRHFVEKAVSRAGAGQTPSSSSPATGTG